MPKPVTQVAHYDLACNSIDVVNLKDGTYAASGCGRGAVYASVCDQGGCRYGRLRNGHEAEVAGVPAYGPTAPAETRTVLPAPPPAERDIQAAPPPGPPAREILPAPPPAAEVPGASSEPTSDLGSAVAPASVVSTGDLSAPYQTQVPVVQASQQSLYPPPVALIETRPWRPSPGYIWVNGYWWWGSSSWLWLPGYWSAPYYGYSYLPGRWYWSTGYWRYGPGGWASPGSTVIVRQAERPSSVATVRALTPVRVAAAGASGTRGGAIHSGPSAGFRSGGAVVSGGRTGGAVVSGGQSSGAVVSGGRGADGVARVSPSFRPQASPLYRYPTTPQGTATGLTLGSQGQGVGTMPHQSYGRVVSPGAYQSGSRAGAGRSSVGVGGNSGPRPDSGFQSGRVPSYTTTPHVSGARSGGNSGFGGVRHAPAPSSSVSSGGFRGGSSHGMGGGGSVRVGGGGGGRRR